MMKHKLFFRLDGEEIEPELIEKFNLRKDSRNIRYSYSKKCEVLNFVGFIIQDNMLLISLPKHYTYRDNLVNMTETDIYLLFNVLLRDQVKNVKNYIGEIENYESNFPFKSFFSIYRYYTNYGLYKETRTITKPGYNKKIEWKDTIRKSTNIISGNNLIYIPFYSKEIKKEHVFLTECMVYAISYTLKNYSMFVKGKIPTQNFNNFDFFSNREYVLSKLKKIYSEVFKDIDKQLIRDLIDFFSFVPEGGNTTIKHYNFELIWESMVEKYLNDFFVEVVDEGLVFSKQKTNEKFNFKKEVFYVDKAHPRNRLEPDHYFNDGDQQFIFDSKYYSKVHDLNHKQVAYYTFLRKKANQTYNALIVPTENESSPLPTPLHFELKESFYAHPDDQIKIWEYYLNMADAMENYIK